MPPLEDIAGPVGAIVVLVAAVGFLVRVATLLWNEHKASDQRERDAGAAELARERARTDASEARLERALDGLKEHTYVTDKAVALAQAAVARLDAGVPGG